jgi:hypothetical protein
MEAASTSETSFSFYQTTRRIILEDNHLILPLFGIMYSTHSVNHAFPYEIHACCWRYNKYRMLYVRVWSLGLGPVRKVILNLISWIKCPGAVVVSVLAFKRISCSFQTFVTDIENNKREFYKCVIVMATSPFDGNKAKRHVYQIYLKQWIVPNIIVV